MKPGLSRIRNFLESMGSPQDKLKVIHIAGTNGKGSTAVFISEILIAGGYKTALYTSPHLIDITERIKINGKNISAKIFNILSKKYLGKAIKYKLSYFEYLTALAFIYFTQRKVDIAVIETGLGGRFDATNIIKNPLVCVITSIAKEHQEILGNTIEKIAFEKARIIKKGSYVVCGKLPKEAIAAIKNKSTPYMYGFEFKSVNNKNSKYGQEFDYIYKNIKLQNIKIHLLGIYQIINASVAVFVAGLLRKKEYFLTETHIRTGLKNAVWQGRFDIRKVSYKNKNIELVIDGAHNVQGLSVFFETFVQLGFSKKKRIFIFAVMKEKKYKCMIKKIAPFAKKVILPQINNDRAVSPKVLRQEFSKYIAQSKIYTIDSIKSIFNIIGDNETIVVVGSLYLVGEVLKYKE
ncbi:MAG: bifunctional folylpolyglutamate synthase/dihydrofolate synthase [Endomicrobium sp.]|jgi:dihydrofolate synthase/folylpolyglutamate synthase|nr:bifunctional folylpolyglutamate synthase/dihydrofolate synthase [Endomicrobium sp.]